VLHDIYSIKPISSSRRATLIQKLSKDLTNWRNELVQFLDNDYINSSLLLPIYQRQRNVLNLAHWHALILVYRPLLLNNFARQSQHGGRVNVGEEELQTEDGVQHCLAAAMSTVNTINEIAQRHQLFRAFWVWFT